MRTINPQAQGCARCSYPYHAVRRGVVVLLILLNSKFVLAGAASTVRQPIFEVIPITDFWHQQRAKNVSTLIDVMGSGACVLDYNRDGWTDVLLVGGSGQTRKFGKNAWWATASKTALLENHGNGLLLKNQDFDALVPEIPGMGCATADLNLDGYDDIVLTGYRRFIVIENHQGKAFTLHDLTEALSFDSKWPMGVTVMDADDNQYPDLYVANYVDFSRHQRLFEKETGFQESRASSLQVDQYDGQVNVLFINEGDKRHFSFQDKTIEYGLLETTGRSLGALWKDLNFDGQNDLLVTNDRGVINHFYIKDNTGKRFKRVELSSGMPFSQGQRHVLSFKKNEQHWLWTARRHGLPSNILIDSHRQAGQLNYEENNWQVGGVSEYDLYRDRWSVHEIDVDQDGCPDIFTTAGGAFPAAASSATSQPQANLLHMGRCHSDADVNHAYEEYRQSFERFEIVNEPMTSSRGAVVVDLDNDGAQDLLVTSNNGPAYWLKNTTPINNNVSTNINAHTNISSTSSSLEQTQHHGYLSLSVPSRSSLQKTQHKTPTGSLLFPALILMESSEAHDHTLMLAAYRALSEKDKRRFIHFASHISESAPFVFSEPLFLYLLANEGAASTRPLLHWIQAMESEALVHYLMSPAGAQGSLDYRCGIAEVMGRLFQEEEAVVERKGFFVDWLVNQVQQESNQTPEQAICFLSVLGESESFRALDSLKTMALHANPSVQRAAILALGTLRETRAVPFIQNRLKETQDRIVMDAGFTALRRLNFCCLEQWASEHAVGLSIPLSTPIAKVPPEAFSDQAQTTSIDTDLTPTRGNRNIATNELTCTEEQNRKQAPIKVSELKQWTQADWQSFRRHLECERQDNNATDMAAVRTYARRQLYDGVFEPSAMLDYCIIDDQFCRGAVIDRLFSDKTAKAYKSDDDRDRRALWLLSRLTTKISQREFLLISEWAERLQNQAIRFEAQYYFNRLSRSQSDQNHQPDKQTIINESATWLMQQLSHQSPSVN